MLSERMVTYFEVLVSVGEKGGDFVRLQGSTGEVDSLEETLGRCLGRFLIHFN